MVSKKVTKKFLQFYHTDGQDGIRNGQGIPLQNIHHQEINFPITNHQEIK